MPLTEEEKQKVEYCLQDDPDLICPITRELMRNPVVIESGETVEQEAIEQWFEENNISPTGIPIRNKQTLIPNHKLRALISTFKEKITKEALHLIDKFIEQKREYNMCLQLLNRCVEFEPQRVDLLEKKILVLDVISAELHLAMTAMQPAESSTPTTASTSPLTSSLPATSSTTLNSTVQTSSTSQMVKDLENRIYARFELFEVYHRKGNYEKQIPLLLQVFSLQKQLNVLLSGVWHKASLQPEENSRKTFLSVKKVLSWLVEAYLKTKQISSAVRMCTEILTLYEQDGKHAKALFLLQSVLSKCTDISDKVVLLERKALVEEQLGMETEAAESWFSAGECYQVSKMFDHSIHAFTNAINADSNMVEAYLRLKDIYLQLQDKKKAAEISLALHAKAPKHQRVKILEEVLSIDEDCDRAYELLISTHGEDDNLAQAMGIIFRRLSTKLSKSSQPSSPTTNSPGPDPATSSQQEMATTMIEQMKAMNMLLISQLDKISKDKKQLEQKNQLLEEKVTDLSEQNKYLATQVKNLLAREQLNYINNSSLPTSGSPPSMYSYSLTRQHTSNYSV